MSLEKITRREAMALFGTVFGFIAGCRDKDHDRIVPVPGISQDEAFHTVRGNVKDTDGIPISTQVSVANIGSSSTDSNGNYSISSVPNGTHQLIIDSSGFFVYADDRLRVDPSSGTITRNVRMIRREQLIGTVYRNLLDMLKDVTENRDGRAGTSPDSIQRVRRFDLGSKIKVYTGNSSLSTQSDLALRDWESELGRALFEFSNVIDANIEFEYDATSQKGQTQVIKYDSVNGVGIVQKAKIILDNSLNSTEARKSALREIGHVLFGAERYSKDDVHATFKDPNNQNLIRATGISQDEVNLFNAYYALPIGENLNPYRI